MANDLDGMPYDASETADTDGDGIGDNADIDDDGDGFSDFLEADCETDPLDYDSQPQDDDGDGICNALDRIVIELYLIDDEATWDSGEALIGDLETSIPSFGTLNDSFSLGEGDFAWISYETDAYSCTRTLSFCIATTVQSCITWGTMNPQRGTTQPSSTYGR